MRRGSVIGGLFQLTEGCLFPGLQNWGADADMGAVAHLIQLFWYGCLQIWVCIILSTLDGSRQPLSIFLYQGCYAQVPLGRNSLGYDPHQETIYKKEELRLKRKL